MLWKVLRDQGVPADYICLLQRLYSAAQAYVRTDVSSRLFHICRGVRQGDPISPLLFITIMEHIFTRLKAEWKRANVRRKGPEFGIRVCGDGDTLTNLRFADDCILFAQSKSDAQKMLRRFMEVSAEYGLLVHPGKTKLMAWTHSSFGCQSLQIGANTFMILDESDSEKYLGRKLCLNGCQSTELQHRIASGWAKFQSFRGELMGRNYSIKSRLRLFEAVVSTTVLSGSCTWALTHTMNQTLDRVRRRMLRLVLRIFRKKICESDEVSLESWPEYLKRSARIIGDFDAAFKLSPWSLQAKARKWRFAGDLVRSCDSRWSKVVLDWMPACGKRSAGRPITRWVDDIERYAGGDWEKLAANPGEGGTPLQWLRAELNFLFLVYNFLVAHDASAEL